ncbi:MAG: hypothetical protein IV100_26215 [Myxococcales bacterium]|nr:hypothetical protein [Myxococcales bacterium]
MFRQFAIALFVLVVIFNLPRAASAEEHPRPNHAIVIDPLTPIFGALLGVVALELEYQWAPHDYVGLTLIPSFAYVKSKYYGDEVTGVGGGVRVGPRVLPQGRRLGGAYILPFVGYAQAAAAKDSSSISTKTISVGLEAGYSWVWHNGFVINLGAGFRHDIELADEFDDSLVISPILNFTLGYSW